MWLCDGENVLSAGVRSCTASKASRGLFCPSSAVKFVPAGWLLRCLECKCSYGLRR
jgi:hypothetical protein